MVFFYIFIITDIYITVNFKFYLCVIVIFLMANKKFENNFFLAVVNKVIALANF